MDYTTNISKTWLYQLWHHFIARYNNKLVMMVLTWFYAKALFKQKLQTFVHVYLLNSLFFAIFFPNNKTVLSFPTNMVLPDDVANGILLNDDNNHCMIFYWLWLLVDYYYWRSDRNCNNAACSWWVSSFTWILVHLLHNHLPFKLQNITNIKHTLL